MRVVAINLCVVSGVDQRQKDVDLVDIGTYERAGTRTRL